MSPCHCTFWFVLPKQLDDWYTKPTPYLRQFKEPIYSFFRSLSYTSALHQSFTERTGGPPTSFSRQPTVIQLRNWRMISTPWQLGKARSWQLLWRLPESRTESLYLRTMTWRNDCVWRYVDDFRAEWRSEFKFGDGNISINCVWSSFLMIFLLCGDELTGKSMDSLYWSWEDLTNGIIVEVTLRAAWQLAPSQAWVVEVGLQCTWGHQMLWVIKFVFCWIFGVLRTVDCGLRTVDCGLDGKWLELFTSNLVCGVMRLVQVPHTFGKVGMVKMWWR